MVQPGFNIANRSILFTFGYPNLMLSLLHYYFQLLLQYKYSFIRSLCSCGICIHCACCVLLHTVPVHKPKQPKLTPSGRLVNDKKFLHISKQINQKIERLARDIPVRDYEGKIILPQFVRYAYHIPVLLLLESLLHILFISCFQVGQDQ